MRCLYKLHKINTLCGDGVCPSISMVKVRNCSKAFHEILVLGSTQNLSGEFNFGAYWPNLTCTLHEAQNNVLSY